MRALVLCLAVMSAGATPAWTVRKVALDTGGARGISGIAKDPAGRMWAVAERDRVLFRLRLDGPAPGIDGPPLRLEGIPSGWDTESLAWLGPGLIALGTENLAERKSEIICTATVSKDRATVIENPGPAREAGGPPATVLDSSDGAERPESCAPPANIAIPLKPWKLTGKPNWGVEGLCASGDHVLAAFETTWDKKDRRFAAIAARTGKGPWVALRLVLTSEKGKISSLACRSSTRSKDVLEVLAIERHYEISRLLRFEVPLDGQRHTLEPELHADLAALIAPPMPNLESVEWLDEKTLVLISDDSHLPRAATEAIFLSR